MMKILILIVFLTGAVAVQAQEKKESLKDLLFKGKLKKDSSGVVRSSDDLSKKIDTSTKKEAPPVVNTTTPSANTQQNKNVADTKTDANTGVTTAVADTAATTTAPTNTVANKSNTKLWKEYTDNLLKSLKEDVLKAKQIKKNTYYMLVDYDIETDGQVTITNVAAEPESAYLQAQVKQIMESTPLKLNPVVDGNNQPKKVKRKQQFTITKE